MKTPSNLHQNKLRRIRTGITAPSSLIVFLLMAMLAILSSENASSQQVIDLFVPVFNCTRWDGEMPVQLSILQLENAGKFFPEMYNTQPAINGQPMNAILKLQLLRQTSLWILKNACNVAYDFTVQVMIKMVHDFAWIEETLPPIQNTSTAFQKHRRSFCKIRWYRTLRLNRDCNNVCR
jgi:hypothetical protein